MAKFSIVVVCLNAGERLKMTVESILAQTCGDYEIVVKDGMSTDGSVEVLPQDERIRIFKEKDKLLNFILTNIPTDVNKIQGAILQSLRVFFNYTTDELSKLANVSIDIINDAEDSLEVSTGSIEDILWVYGISTVQYFSVFSCMRKTITSCNRMISNRYTEIQRFS